MKQLDWNALDAGQRAAVLARPAIRDGVDAAPIVDEVRRGGDEALRQLTERLDGVVVDDLVIGDAVLDVAAGQLEAAQRAAIDTAYRTIRAFHDQGRTRPYAVETAPGVTCRRELRPIRAVGLYVPGGTAPLPSTALMLGVPAELAGCPVRVLCTPPRADGSVHPAILYAARLCGIEQVFRVGGAQAIAAMAYGTATIPRVDKVFGPGNAWVTAAKQLVAQAAGGVTLDMPAGPSELMVVADATAHPEFVAADLLSQAEHGPDSQVFLVTADAAVADAVVAAVARRVDGLARGGIARAALESSRVLRVVDRAQATEVVNMYAPEHLSLAVGDAAGFLDGVESAGSVFIGPWTPEALGDYCSGTSHVLPTYGYARALSGLSVTDFEKRITVQEATRAGLAGLGPVAVALATLEGLDGHADAIKVRLAS
jgi:histidinol dehydrogenase